MALNDGRNSCSQRLWRSQLTSRWLWNQLFHIRNDCNCLTENAMFQEPKDREKVQSDANLNNQIH